MNYETVLVDSSGDVVELTLTRSCQNIQNLRRKAKKRKSEQTEFCTTHAMLDGATGLVH